MNQKTDNEKRATEILERLLDSYPCKTCDKFKKYISEIRSAWINSGGYKDSYSKEIISRINMKRIEHVEEVHLPSKEEWEILSESNEKTL